MILALLLAAAQAVAQPPEAPWVATGESFEDSAACTARLQSLADADRAEGGYEAVQGPYEIGAGDVRIHKVKAEARGHRITETRCLDKELASRSWKHSMESEEEEGWLESAAKGLQKPAPQQ